MALVKKINPEWKPAENRSLQVGEIIDINDYRRLVEGGDAVLVDEYGEEQPLPGTIFICPFPGCFAKYEVLAVFTEHFGSAHIPAKEAATSLPVEAPEPEVKAAVDDIKAKRLASLEKARAARAAKK